MLGVLAEFRISMFSSFTTTYLLIYSLSYFFSHKLQDYLFKKENKINRDNSQWNPDFPNPPFFGLLDYWKKSQENSTLDFSNQFLLAQLFRKILIQFHLLTTYLLRKTKTRTENTNRVTSSDFLLSIHLFVSCNFCKRQLNRSSTLLLKSKKAQSYVAFRATYFFITGKQKREPTS